MGVRKPKKPSRRKLLAEWSRQVRDRDGNACAVCGATEHCQSHHLLPKERFAAFMYEVDNGLTLCAGKCHKFGAYSAHANPIWFAEWLRANRPDLHAIALRRISTGPSHSSSA